MAYRKRDYLYPKSGTSKTVVLIKNHAPILISDDSGPPALVQDRMTSEMMDGSLEEDGIHFYDGTLDEYLESKATV